MGAIQGQLQGSCPPETFSLLPLLQTLAGGCRCRPYHPQGGSRGATGRQGEGRPTTTLQCLILSHPSLEEPAGTASLCSRREVEPAAGPAGRETRQTRMTAQVMLHGFNPLLHTPKYFPEFSHILPSGPGPHVC